MPTSHGSCSGVAIYLATFAATIGCLFAGPSGPAARAQNLQEYVIQGYVTAVHPPDSFEVNGTPLIADAETRYGLIGNKSHPAQSAMPDELSLGAFVRVTEITSNSSKLNTARLVLLRDDGGRKVSGYGVIEEVKQVGPDRAFQADGYWIRISPSTAVEFSGGLKSLTDAGPNTWLRYQGRQSKDGELDATKATLIAPKLSRLKPRKDQKPQVTSPSKVSIIDGNGRLASEKMKVRYSDTTGWCGWHRVTDDDALQERVQRIGQKLIPAYQNALPASSRAKIPFRFYVIDEDGVRSERACIDGLILVPRQAVERLQGDDQIAALIADGIAFNLQFQAAALAVDPWVRTTGQVVELAFIATEPVALLTLDPLDWIIQYQTALRMQEQRSRMALAMMADAGYDPWQAPEAWRRLAPRHELTDPTSLRYPSRSGYQLTILYLQYGRRTASQAAELSVPNDAATPP